MQLRVQMPPMQSKPPPHSPLQRAKKCDSLPTAGWGDDAVPPHAPASPAKPIATEATRSHTTVRSFVFISILARLSSTLEHALTHVAHHLAKLGRHAVRAIVRFHSTPELSEALAKRAQQLEHFLLLGMPGPDIKSV